MITSVAIANQHFRDVNPRACGRETCSPSHGFGPAVRSFWLLHYIMEGEGTFRTERGEYRLGPSQVFVIRPGELTYYEADGRCPWTYVWIGFESSVAMPEILNRDTFALPQGRELFASLPRARDMASGKEAYLCGKIWELLWLLSAGPRPAGRKELYIQQAKNYIESEYMTGITVNEVAARLGLDRSYFSNLFRLTEGMTPQRYLCEVRMGQAARQLMERGDTVTETAASVGYSDVFAFSRMFKRRFGVPPSQYRDRCGEQRRTGGT